MLTLNINFAAFLHITVAISFALVCIRLNLLAGNIKLKGLSIGLIVLHCYHYMWIACKKFSRQAGRGALYPFEINHLFP